jgi:hypothetical protein
MTAKTRGIRLKAHLSPTDQGQQKLIQVTFSQLAAQPGRTPRGRQAHRLHTPTASERPAPSPAIPQTRRQIIARMLRIELEATLALLDHALERTEASAAAVRSKD